MIYFVVLILLLLLSIYYDINGKVKNTKFWYRFMLVVFILIAGLRWRVGIDTPNYIMRFYYVYPTLDDFSFENYGIGRDPLFVLINSIVKTFGGRFYIVQLIQATIVNVLVFKYIKKHSKYFFTCIMFYFAFFYSEYNMEIMRGGLSIVICLFANDYILDKKWLKGYLLYCLALMFHLQTLILFVLPLLFFMRLNKTGIAILAGAFLIAGILNILIGDYLSMLEMVSEAGANKAENYMNSGYGEQRHNLKYITVMYIPDIFYSILSLYYIKKKDSHNPLLNLEPLLLLGVMFAVMRLNLAIAYRFVDYFRVYILLFESELFINLLKGSCRLDKTVICVRTFIIFVPLFFHIGFWKYKRRLQYFPYSSVIDRKMNKDREKYLHGVNPPRPSASDNEY